MSYIKIGLAVAAFAVLAFVAVKLYDAGKMEQRNETLEQNDRSRTGADKFDDDRVKCLSSGRVFDWSTGKCRRS